MNNLIMSPFPPSVKLGVFCVIEEGVDIHDNVTIENYVLLKKGTVIYKNTFIDSYVRSSGNNSIGANVIIRFGATIARNVIIRDGAFISPNVMTVYLTHDLNTKVRPTIIGEKAFIGTGAVIGPGVKIGDGVVIGALSYVSKDCIEPGTYVGVPAKKIK